MRLGIFALVLSLVVPVVHAQQQPPREQFIERAEHMHGTRETRPPAPAPHQTGQWKTLDTLMPINPVHVALMHNGKVLVIAGSGNDPRNSDLEAAVWDPANHTVNVFKIAYDMFCNGMVVLPDGKPFVISGTQRYDPFEGERKNSAFNPSSGTFTQKASMADGRWYPTGTVLGDGNVLTISGRGSDGETNLNIEIYHPSSDSWSHSGTAFDAIPLYPRMTLLPNGQVFESGSNYFTGTYTLSTGKWDLFATTKYGKYRDGGTSVLLPLTPSGNFAPRVMILGGGQEENQEPIVATETTEIIDLAASNPAWRSGPNMVAGRVQLNATLLPGGRLLVSGGSSTDEKPSTAVREAQLYDPDTDAFVSAETMEFPRLYHSNTLLLPDATVMAVGGNPARGEYEPHVEIYSPPYLFKADGSRAARPTISSSTTSTIHYGASFDVHTSQAADIESVELIRPGAVTHAFDMEQRVVVLSRTKGSGVVHATAPSSANIAPPGYYLLFIVNSNKVPSVAHWVHLTSAAPAR